MVGLFIWLDVFKLMTIWETLGLLLLGALAAVAAYPVSGVFLDQLPLGFSTYSRFAAPWIEELLKGAVIVGLFAFNRIGFKLDAVISGFAVGAGFSVVENMIYLTRFPELTASVWMVRGLGTAVMHGTTLAILAAIAHEFAERETRQELRDYQVQPAVVRPRPARRGRAAHRVQPIPRPAAAGDDGHTAVRAAGDDVDFQVRLERGAAMAGGRARHAPRAARRCCAPASSPTMRAASGSPRWPSALRSRRRRTRIREYCEALTALVLTAEDTLLQQSSDSDRVSADAAATFKRVEN